MIETEIETEELWDVPLVDFYIIEAPEGDFPTRQANGLLVHKISTRDDDPRLVVSLTLYSTELKAGLVMPLSPETIIQLSSALLALSEKPEGKLQ